MAILTIDLGTTNTKAAVWAPDGLVSIGRAGLVTSHPLVGRAEQDADRWWPSVVSACSECSSAALASVEAIGFSGARQTFVPTTADGRPIGPALLWSDSRGGGSVAGKIDWLRANEPSRITAARWLLGPRDLIAWRLSGEVATDWTHASANGMYESGEHSDLLPTPVASTTVIGSLLPGPAAELGLRPGLPIVIGAGDRQCEVLGSGATRARPMVSWGTTANVSAPVGARPDPAPDGIIATRAATSGWLLEGGVSAAGSLLSWLSGLVGVGGPDLWARAALSPAGARGVLALPWLGGARAPWWNDRAGAAFLGISPAHDTGDLARAAVEAVGWEIDRCLSAIAQVSGTADGLAVSGAGPLWTQVLTSITGLPALHRRSGETASVGAALNTALVVGTPWDLEVLNPVVSTTVPDPALVFSYARLRPAVARAASAVIGLIGD